MGLLAINTRDKTLKLITSRTNLLDYVIYLRMIDHLCLFIEIRRFKDGDVWIREMCRI